MDKRSSIYLNIKLKATASVLCFFCKTFEQILLNEFMNLYTNIKKPVNIIDEHNLFPWEFLMVFGRSGLQKNI